MTNFASYIRTLILSLLCFPFRPLDAVEFSGPVVGVVDGDSIVVLHEEQPVDVRLEGIDCPELGQAFGRRAKQAASGLAFRKTVTVQVTGRDRYGRTLGNVILPDERNLNHELIRQGYAWWFHRYSDDAALQRIEAAARTAKVGLWSDGQPVAPWDWRAAQRAKLELPPSEIKIVSNGIQIVALLPNPSGRDAGNEQVTIRNETSEPVNLQGWKLVDVAGNVFLLSGSVPSGKSLVVTMTEATLPLNNDGDTVVLLDAEGRGRSRVSYDGPARSGTLLRFGN